MSAGAGITTTGGAPNAVVQVQAGMNVQPVVLVDQNGNYITAPSAVMTTLGDTLYENATPAPARLAGNTTSTKNFYTQTGTGTASAAPAWGTIAAGDLPAATTSAQGAVKLDGTAGDIQNTGPQAAGNSTQAAAANHVHFSSGMYLCAPTSYAPPAKPTLSISTTTMAVITGAASTVAAGSNGGEISQIASWSSPSAGVLAVAAGAQFPVTGGTFTVATSTTTATVTYTGVSGNTLTGCAYVSGSATGTVSTGGAVTLTSAVASTGSFTAPVSGSVFVTVYVVINNSTSGTALAFGLAAHGTITPMVGNAVTGLFLQPDVLPFTLQFLITGLTAGTSYNLDLLGCAASGQGGSVYAWGQSTTTPSLTGGGGAPLVMTVQAV